MNEERPITRAELAIEQAERTYRILTKKFTGAQVAAIESEDEDLPPEFEANVEMVVARRLYHVIEHLRREQTKTHA